MTVAAVDWDGTLVDVHTQEWLPGAVTAIHTLLRTHKTLLIHTCRGNWPEGVASIEAKLDTSISPYLQKRILVVGKPQADVYIDDRAVRFVGWPATLERLT